MNFMKNFLDFEEEVPQINILPMIDIIFVILSFFIISSLYLVKLETIPINLPKATTSNQEINSVIIISLNLENQIFIDAKLLDINFLKNEIITMIKNSNLKKVIIKADKDIKYEKIISLLDILRTIDGIKIGVSTE